MEAIEAVEDDMSHSKSTEIKRPDNLVRLHIDGMKTAVNTLRDQETAKGVSLVCPFPALEVDIPVQFGAGADLSIGSIHRIGVEDDPVTGLPRLRLAVRTRETTRPTVVAKASETLLQAVQSDADTGDIRAPKSSGGGMVRPAGSGSWAEFLSEIADPDASDASEEGYSMTGSDDDQCDEPKWASGADVQLPEEIAARVVTRRRYRMVRHVAGAFVLGMLAASVFLFDRAGVVSISGIVERAVAAVSGEAEIQAPAKASPETVPPAPEKAPAAVAEQLPAPDVASPAPKAAAGEGAQNPLSPGTTAASYTPGPNPLMAGIKDVAEDTPALSTPAAPGTAEESSVDEKVAASDVVETGAASEEDGAATEDDVTLLLPTRWPVEYATAYRVREPNGVVVDVPGGLVKREGWLEDGKENPMVRSIKSIQRESGARFIVYVNGELPRFITAPKPNGVSLRLYVEQDVMKTAAVASLD